MLTTVILFFGTRTGRARETRLDNMECPFCGQRGQMTARVVPHYVHLFWIPVFRLRPLAEVICGHCKRVYTGSELSPEMQSALETLK